MIEIIPFDKNLVSDWRYDGIETELSGENIIEIASFYSKLGKGFIGFVDGRIIGIGGVYPLYDNWGSAWLFLNKEAKSQPVGIFKTILERMTELINEYGIKVLSVQCLDESMEANRLLSHLGFVKDKEIKMALYSRINGRKI